MPSVISNGRTLSDTETIFVIAFGKKTSLSGWATDIAVTLPYTFNNIYNYVTGCYGPECGAKTGSNPSQAHADAVSALTSGFGTNANHTYHTIYFRALSENTTASYWVLGN